MIMTSDTKENVMARTGTPAAKPEEPGQEQEVDYMSEAPPARPYAEAVSESHRELLATAGIHIERPEA